MANKYGGIYFDESRKTYYVKTNVTTLDGYIAYITKRGFTSKSDALKYKNNEVEKLKNSYKFEIDNPKISFYEFLNLYIEDYGISNVPSSTYAVSKIIDKHIKPNFVDIPMSKMKPSMFNCFTKYVASLDVTSKRKNTIINRLKDIINVAIKRSRIEYKIGNIMIDELKPVVDDGHIVSNDYWSIDEYHKFMSVIPKDSDYYFLFTTLFNLGCRISELRGLKWSDLSVDDKTVHIHAQITNKVSNGHWSYIEYTKNKLHKHVLISQYLCDLLVSLKKTRGYRNEQFMFFGNSPRSEHSINYAKAKYCDLAGVKRIRNHDFRHSYTTYLKDCGIETKTISKQLGHINTNVTENVYNHVSSVRKAELMQVIENIEKKDV